MIQLASEHHEHQKNEKITAREQAKQDAREQAKQDALRKKEAAMEAERKIWASGKVLAHGDLCGQCQHFTKKGFWDLYRGYCDKLQITTYKNFGCSGYAKR